MDRTKATFVLQALNTNDLGDLCFQFNISSAGVKVDKVERILSNASGWPELVEKMTVGMLRYVCEEFRVPTRGTKAELASAVEAFVEQASADVLERKLNGMLLPAVNQTGIGWSGETSVLLSTVPTILDITRDNIISVLKDLKLSRYDEEAKAQDKIFSVLVDRFGHDHVGREGVIGGFTFTQIDFDITRTYGIEVKVADGLFTFKRGKGHGIERLLGQLVLYQKHYKPENLFVVVAGEVSAAQRAPLNELRQLVREQGCELICPST